MRTVFASAFLVASVFGQTSEKASPVLTPAQALQIRNLSALEFSPDGTHLALVVRDPVKGTTAASHIWVLHLPTSELRQWTSSSKTERGPQWSPDGQSLAFISDRDERAQIYVLRVSGGEALKLTEGKNAVNDFRWSPDGKQIAFLAGEPKTEHEEKRERDKQDARVVDRDEKHQRLWVLEIASRKLRQLTKGPWRLQEVRWLPAGDKLVVKATDHPESDEWRDAIYTVQVADGTLTEVGRPKGPFGAIKISQDGRSVAYLGSAAGGPAEHDLFSQPINGVSARNITGPLLDRPIRGYDWRSDGSLVGLIENGFRYELHSIRVSGTERMLTGFPLQPFELAVSRQGKLAFVAGNSTTPPELWVSNNPAEAPKQISKFNESWHAIPLRPAEFVTYNTFDGTSIEAALIQPPPYRPQAKLPLIVLVHGGPTGAWVDRFNAWAQLLAARGYLVLCPNVRGSTGYGQKFIEKNRADWGGGDFKDVMAGVDWLIKRGDADPDRLGIGGWSYGGYMAAWATTQTNRFKAAVAGAGMSDLATEYGTEQGPAYDEWFFGVPYEHPEAFQKSSPLTYVRNARTPTLILQGEADKIDPVSQSQMLYRALKRYGVKTDFVVYPREGHGITEEKHALDVLERMLAWFDEHVKH